MTALRRLFVRSGLMTLLAAHALATGGCGTSGPVVVVNRNSDPTRDRLIQIGYAYREVYTRTGRPPKSLDDLRPVMKESGTPEEALVSTRDGKPFEVVWGKAFFVVADPNHKPSILIHEAIGKDTSRYVYWDNGMAELLPEEKFSLAQHGTR